MFLDDVDYTALDPDNMRGHIDAFPDQLEQAWNRARTLDLPADFRNVTRIVMTGMGDSIIAADLLAALAETYCTIPIFINRDYHLPAFASGTETLVIAMSYSGTTEETLSSAAQAAERGAQLLAITTGGALADQVTSAGGTVWRVDYSSQSRAALGWLYGLLLAAAGKLKLLPDLDANVVEAIERLRRDREVWKSDTLTNRNSAKRVAGQFVDRIPVIWGGGFLAPVARRWKTQFNANAKTAAFYEIMPEVNHNAIVGIVAPEELINRHKIQIIQLVSAQYDHPRVFLRHESTDDMLREAGIISEIVKARGEGRLAQQMNLVQFGDYVSFFLAMANNVDPTPVIPIDRLKQKMAEAG